MNNNRIIYDKCTPTRERRPTTRDDIMDDVVVKDFDTAEELYDELLNILDIYEDEEELEGSLNERIKTLLSWFNDPGDGSPNILYLLLDGEEISGTLPYDELEGLNLRTVKQEDLQKALIDADIEMGYIDDEEDEYDEDDEYEDDEDE